MAILVLVVVIGGWFLMAVQAASDFDDRAGGSGACSGNPDELIRPPRYANATMADELRPVAKAFDAYFAQDRFRYIEGGTRDGVPEDDIGIAVDGDLLQRTDEDGFIGLIDGGDRVAQFEGDRWWVPACVNGARFPDRSTLQAGDCASSAPAGKGTRYEWALLRDSDTCDDPPLQFSATIVDGLPTEWGFVLTSETRRIESTSTAVDPVSLTWPSPIWIVPNVVASAGD
ncbi:MAG: hypothetical protein ACTHN0_07905 [Aquihabitans sp.]